MIRALWFAVKVGALIALAVWVADRPGQVHIEWMEYTVNMQMGLFLLVMMAAILIAIFIYQFIRALVTFPSSWARYNEIKAREKGWRALTQGLTAVAAGDKAAAGKFSKKASKYLGEDDGLPLLLEAQAARLDGRDHDAAKSFVKLLEHKEAGFLGVRGLLQSAMDAEDYETAHRLCERALKSYPKQKWILNLAFELAIKLRHWDEALKVLKKARVRVLLI